MVGYFGKMLLVSQEVKTLNQRGPEFESPAAHQISHELVRPSPAQKSIL
jgi:hypothetical protein